MTILKQPHSTHKKSIHFMMFVDTQKTKTFSLQVNKFKWSLVCLSLIGTALIGSGVYAINTEIKLSALQGQVKELKAGAIAAQLVYENELGNKDFSAKATLHSKILTMTENISTNSQSADRDFSNESKFAELKSMASQISLQSVTQSVTGLNPQHMPQKNQNATSVADSNVSVKSSLEAKSPSAPRKIPFSTQALTVEGDNQTTELAVTFTKEPSSSDLKNLIGHVCLNLGHSNGETSPCVQRKRVSYSNAKKAIFTLNESVDSISSVSFDFVPSKPSAQFEANSGLEEWELSY